MVIVAHNLLALNANRQLNITNKSKTKTTEKLSSGYRINRAADDSSGLSISEKMRRQIRGLSQGVENTQSGVSLCQVADGALGEVNDMLHRITELSVKSANETNSEQDRQYIQEEINHLLSEIDRIGKTTTYNELQLFAEGKKASISTPDTPPTPTTPPPTPTVPGSIDYINKIQSTLSMVGTPIGLSSGTKKINATENGLEIEGNQISWNDVKTTSGVSLDIDNIATGTYQFSWKGLDFSFDVLGGGKEELIQALDGTSFKINSLTTSVDAIEITTSGLMQGSKTEAVLSHGRDFWKNNNGYGYAIEASESGLTVIDKWYNESEKLTFTTIPWSNLGIDDLNNAGGKTINFNDPESGFYFTAKIADDATKQDILNSFTKTNSVMHYGMQGASETQNDYVGYTANTGRYTFKKIDENFFHLFGYTNNTDLLTGMSLSVEELKGTDGKYYLKLTAPNGNSTTVSYNSTDGKYAFASNVSSTYIPANAPLYLSGVRNVSIPSFYYVKYDFSSQKIYNTTYTADTLMTKPQTPTSPADPADPSTPSNPGTITPNKDSRPLRLWIQSGCDSADGMYIEINKMNTSILGINDLDVSTADNAKKALSAVDTALQRITANRSKIGAQQNRLEHTITNEENIIENTTATESRIRDTDMAKEMVTVSLQNTLSQVGQSMLAQANQNHQTVLSLLS